MAVREGLASITKKEPTRKDWAYLTGEVRGITARKAPSQKHNQDHILLSKKSTKPVVYYILINKSLRRAVL